MELEKVHLDTLTLVGFQHVGKVTASSQAWPKLNDFLALTRIATPDGKCVGIQYTDETHDECHYDMGFSVDPDSLDLSQFEATIEDNQYPYIKHFQVEGGVFVSGRHTGEYYGVPGTYHRLLDAARSEGLDVQPLPYVQFYRNHPRFVAEKDLVTDLFIRIND